MDQDREAQQHRLRNRQQSDAAKLAWKRHHSSYMRGTRKRERDMENKTFYSLAKVLDEKINEEKVVQNNVFDTHSEICFDTIAGGIAINVNSQEQTVSISVSFTKQGSGSYSLEQGDVEALYKPLTEDLQNSCEKFVLKAFVIDEQGYLQAIMPKVKPDTNAAEILSYLAGE